MSRRMNSSTSRRLRWCLVVFAVVSGLCVSGPAIYWKLSTTLSAWTCPPCQCKCPPPLSLLTVAPGIVNLTSIDCETNDPDLKQELHKRFVDLLNEELKLQEQVLTEHMQHANVTFHDARKVASKYQKEADKCNTATETCEGARERAEILMRKERKLTSLWEQRARQLGFEEE